MTPTAAGRTKRNSDERSPMGLTEGQPTKQASNDMQSTDTLAHAVSAFSALSAPHLTLEPSLDVNFEEAKSLEKTKSFVNYLTYTARL